MRLENKYNNCTTSRSNEFFGERFLIRKLQLDELDELEDAAVNERAELKLFDEMDDGEGEGGGPNGPSGEMERVEMISSYLELVTLLKLLADELSVGGWVISEAVKVSELDKTAWTADFDDGSNNNSGYRIAFGDAGDVEEVFIFFGFDGTVKLFQ